MVREEERSPSQPESLIPRNQDGGSGELPATLARSQETRQESLERKRESPKTIQAGGRGSREKHRRSQKRLNRGKERLGTASMQITEISILTVKSGGFLLGA